MKNQKISTKRIAMAGLLAALTAVGSALRITVPVDLVGTSSIHLGNIFCALSGVLLGPGLGGLAAGLGSAIYDMTNPIYISECWLTFLMKGAYALAAGLVFKHLKLKEYLRSEDFLNNPLRYAETMDAEMFCNMCITLICQDQALLGKLILAQQKQFEENGGIRELMSRVRREKFKK